MPPSPPLPDPAVRLPVVEERLELGRETHTTGALKVQVQPHEQLHTLDLEAASEAVEIERVAVGRPVDAPRAPWHDGDVLVVPVYEETVVLRRQLVLKEELRLHRRRHTRRWQQDVVLLHDTVNLQRRSADGTWAPAPGTAAPGPPVEGPQAGLPGGTTADFPDPRSKEFFMRQTVVGVFDRFASAQQAADLLRQRGIDAGDIQVTGSDESGQAGLQAEPHEPSLMERIRNFFSGTTDDADEMSAYSEAVRRGGAVVKVQVEDEPKIELARAALESAGAVDIDERMSEWRAGGWSPGSSSDTGGLVASAGPSTADTADMTPAKKSRGKKAAATGTAASTAAGEAEQVIPVVREEVQVGKRAVKAGGVRVYAHLVEEQVRESVDLREERARVERRPTDRPVSESEMQSLGERSVEIEETVERPVVQKTARVVEEVVVGKDVRQKTADVNETVRHTEVDVTDLGTRGTGGSRSFEDFDTDFRSDFGTRFGGTGGGRYEDYEPAYRYGHSLAGDTRYRDRDWDSFERDARSDWERQNPSSPWEKVKAAARHAWERARS